MRWIKAQQCKPNIMINHQKHGDQEDVYDLDFYQRI